MRAQAVQTLYDRSGERKYVNETERTCFLAAAARLSPSISALCHVLAVTGCRLSEALDLCPVRIDSAPHMAAITFRTLKRRAVHFRTVPVPIALVQQLAPLMARAGESHARLWRMHRTTAWRFVRWAMRDAGISGVRASPRGLRHGFGVHAALSGVPLNLIQRWMGHASLKTTMIYLEAFGMEERRFARRMWERGEQ